MASNPNRPPERRVDSSNDNANRYYDLATQRYGMEPEEAQRWASQQLGYSPVMQPTVHGNTWAKEVCTFGGDLPTARSVNPLNAGAIGGFIGTTTISEGFDSGESQSRKRENYSIGSTEGQYNPNYNQPQWGHQQQSYPK